MAIEPQAEEMSFRDSARAVWKHLHHFKFEIALLSILGLISAIANGAIPYITGRFFDALIALAAGESASFGTLPLWSALLLLWALIQILANANDWIMSRTSRKVEVDLQIGIQARGFIHLLRLPMAYHKSERISEIINTVDQASWRVKSVFSTIVGFAPQLLSVVIGTILAFTVNAFLASILLLGAALYTVLLMIMLRPVGKLDATILKEWNETWGDAVSSIHQVESVKQAAAEVHEAHKIESSYFGSVAAKWRKLQYLWNNVNFFQRFLVFATQLAVFAFSVSFIVRGEITVGELIILNGYAQMFFGPFVTLGYNWEALQNGLNAAKRAETVFQASEEVYEPEGHERLAEIYGRISFAHVSFSYDEKGKGGLKDVSFSAEPGETVALVGASGVGKSTTVSLISGYHFPTDGMVHIDGMDTRKLDLLWLRKHIAVVPQEVALFNDTIGNNIRYGTFEATDAEVRAAATKAHIADFIMELPEGFETVVGERGMKLSVGQKQRIAIARAILRDPAILILDEPTSALDAKTEQLITESFEDLMRGRTTFIIAHRLSTVRKAEKILVFEAGRIVETGTHAELIKKDGGVYQKLYEYQIGLH